MSFHARQVYATHQRESSVAIASSAQLVVMTYDRLLEHVRLAQSQMAQGQDAAVALSKALDLITDGLQSCLDLQRGGDIAKNLNFLYDWACREILRARLRQDPQRLQDVLNVFTPLAQAWQEQAGMDNLPIPQAFVSGYASAAA